MKTLVLPFVVAACAHRSSAMYRDDTAKLLAAKDAPIKACYERVLRATPAASGLVTVTFAIEKGTGKLVDAKVDNSASTAPDALVQCVTAELAGLVLAPADRRTGAARWSWDLRPGT